MAPQTRGVNSKKKKKNEVKKQKHILLKFQEKKILRESHLVFVNTTSTFNPSLLLKVMWSNIKKVPCSLIHDFFYILLLIIVLNFQL